MNIFNTNNRTSTIGSFWPAERPFHWTTKMPEIDFGHLCLGLRYWIESGWVGERLEKVFDDQAYNGVFAAELAQWSINFAKASRPESACGFVPVAKRWVVEPVRPCVSIAWTSFFRQVTKDYEHTVSCNLALFSQQSICVAKDRCL